MSVLGTAAAVASGGSASMTGEILLNLSRFISNPATLDWVHHLLVRSEEAQKKLEEARAGQQLEQTPTD